MIGIDTNVLVRHLVEDDPVSHIQPHRSSRSNVREITPDLSTASSSAS